MKRLITLLLPPFLLLAVVVAACDGDGDNGAGTTLEPNDSPAATATDEEPAANSGDRLSTVEIARKLRPSVVQVVTEGAAQDLFGRIQQQQGIGTGVIIDADGLIVTNDHVIRVGDDIANRITVALHDGSTEPAEVVGADPQTDLAVLRIEASGLTPAQLGDAESLPVGAEVVAMGYALGLEGDPSVTRGVVSAKGRTIQEETVSINDALQTDASINPGNSGGPLVDDRGRVIGINTAIFGGGAENIGFAISVDTVKSVTQELIQSGNVQRAFLGISFQDVTPSVARSNDLPVEQGVGVAEVVAGSPADDAGLQVNDIIVSLGGAEITNSGDLVETLRGHQAGDAVTVGFYRGSSEQEVEVTLSERPAT